MSKFKRRRRLAMKVEFFPLDGLDASNEKEMQIVIDELVKSKNPKLSDNAKRLTHFMLYLNTELKHSTWVKNDPYLNRYIHGKPITPYTFYTIVEALQLKPFLTETIMCTPYSFGTDLIEIISRRIKFMPTRPQLSTTVDLVLSMVKSVKHKPIKADSESSFLAHFNLAMMIYHQDIVPNDSRRFDPEDDDREKVKYYGFRLRSLFQIFVAILKLINSPDTDKQYPVYEIKSICDLPTDSENATFNKCVDIIMYKCLDMCNFSIDSWLSWYEVEVLEEDTNLQSSIGHLCFELYETLDLSGINKDFISTFKPIISNMVIEKVDLSDVDINDIAAMLEKIEKSSKAHLNSWIKKMIENPKVFHNVPAIEKLVEYANYIDYNCFKCIIDRLMDLSNDEGLLLQNLRELIMKGIIHLDMEDKMILLKHVSHLYGNNEFKISAEYEAELRYVVLNEHTKTLDRKELVSKLIWLIMQNPKKVFHVLVSQYITGVYELPVKGIDTKRSYLHDAMVEMHSHLDLSIVLNEYSGWMEYDRLQSTERQRQCFLIWILGATRTLHLFKAKDFFKQVLVPCIKPSESYEHMVLLVDLTKFFLSECQLTSLNEFSIWQALIIQLAKILDKGRWTLESFSETKLNLCEKTIAAIQPFFYFGSQTVTLRDLDFVREELAGLHLMTRSHFLRLWTSDYITIDGMDEQFIMTVQSQSHISFSNLNNKSTQKAQEEFIFSIATYLPRFTLYEVKSFVSNYLSTAKPANITEASVFLVESVMNAFMRIIVYLKTALPNESDAYNCAWDCLDYTIVNFLDSTNSSRMSSIYGDKLDGTLGCNCLAKIIMVMKQLEPKGQEPLLIVIRRLVHGLTRRLNKENASKLVNQLLSTKNPINKDVVDEIVQFVSAHLKNINAITEPSED